LDVSQFILVAPILLFSMVAHEYAHGWVAYQNGDPTAYQLGRLTWNPVRHIDPFMTIILPIVLFLSHMPIIGGAKPVPVNPRNYRNFKRGDIMVSLAGIVTNILLAFVCALLIPLLFFAASAFPRATMAFGILQVMFLYGIWINLVLAAFNLLPIPPLDGSHVFKYLLPPAWALSYERVSRYGLLVIYAVLFVSGSLLTWWLAPADALRRVLFRMVDSFLLPSAGAL
jgi:Zn-dependent protease